MAEQQSVTVYITNNSGGNAQIILFHENASNGMQRGSWPAAPGQTVGPLTANFESGWDAGEALDWWSVLIHVKDGPTPGFYISSGTSTVPYWSECQFSDSDGGQTLTFAVSNSEFDVALSSGECSTAMTKLAPLLPITHVFVVMLENRSFDSMFAMSGIKGITAATTKDSNSYQDKNSNQDKTYPVHSPAPLTLTTDPGHEFLDVVEQLCGEALSLSGSTGAPSRR